MSEAKQERGSWHPVARTFANTTGTRAKNATQLGVGAEDLQPGARPSAVLARKRRATIAQESSDLGSLSMLGRSRATADALEKVGLPAPSAIPRLTRTAKSLVTLPLDPQAAFIASQIDGQTTVQNIIDLGLMRRVEAVDALNRLVKLGVVVFL